MGAIGLGGTVHWDLGDKGCAWEDGREKKRRRRRGSYRETKPYPQALLLAS